MILKQLADTYQQLYLPVKEGMSESDEYLAVIRNGKQIISKHLNGFMQSEYDSLEPVDTPIGKITAVYLHHRQDFERFIQIMAYRCEPAVIPASMGADTISGIINWKKIFAHKRAYLADEGTDWSAEFKRFTSNKKNYLDTIIVLSQGPYSNVSHRLTPFSTQQWLSLSYQIRLYHERTHVICQSLYPGLRDCIWDEVIADCMGLLHATGNYNPSMARDFLGLNQQEQGKKGRLANYINASDTLLLQKTSIRAAHIIEQLSAFLHRPQNCQLLAEACYDELLQKIQEQKEEIEHA